jgi:hypothetical protein
VVGRDHLNPPRSTGCASFLLDCARFLAMSILRGLDGLANRTAPLQKCWESLHRFDAVFCTRDEGGIIEQSPAHFVCCRNDLLHRVWRNYAFHRHDIPRHPRGNGIPLLPPEVRAITPGLVVAVLFDDTRSLHGRYLLVGRPNSRLCLQV